MADAEVIAAPVAARGVAMAKTKTRMAQYSTCEDSDTFSLF